MRKKEKQRKGEEERKERKEKEVLYEAKYFF